jgi:hypothetical protein
LFSYYICSPVYLLSSSSSSRRIRWAGHVAQESCWGDLRERDHVEDLGESGRIILKCIFKK